MQVLASKKGAMRALGRVVRSDEAANEVVAAGGLAPIVKLLCCNDPGVVRRYVLLCFLDYMYKIAGLQSCTAGYS